MADDDAPLEVALITTKEQVNKRLKDEKSHQKRHKKNAKKRKRGWAKSGLNKKTKELDESAFNDDDFKNDKEPTTKKRRISKWMEESDLFHHLNNDQNVKNKENDDKEIDIKQQMDDEDDKEVIEGNDNDDDDEDIDFDSEVPQEVIDLFEEAIKDCKTQKEIEDKWAEILEEQSKKYANLKHKFSKFDKLFVDGFQIEVNGVYRLNVSALKRALRMKHFASKKHHRIQFNKKMSYGSLEPSFGFIQGSVNKKYDLKNKKFQPKSFWGKKINNLSKVTEKEQLQKWLDY